MLSADHTIREMAEEMGVPTTTAWRYLHKGLDLLIGLKADYVRWPTPRECAESASQFESYAGIKGIVGSVDCSHVSIEPEAGERVTYTNRKSFYSVHLLAIVDAADRFIFTQCGSSGNQTDSTVLRYSSFNREQFSALCNGQLPAVPYGYIIIADGGFMALPWVVSNYSGTSNLHEHCAAFNNAVAATRHGVERAYGQLKRRFKILGGRSSFNGGETVVKMNEAGVILHNANLDTEARHSSLIRGMMPVSDGAPVPAVARAQKEYAEVVQDLHASNPIDPASWPERVTRIAGKAIRAEVAKATLGIDHSDAL